jgi:aquaporin Z
MTSMQSAHWREYGIEAALLAAFMVSAAAFATLLQHPHSPLVLGPGDTVFQRLPMGVAMGVTAMALIYSPWGARSGAHMNPAVTLTFWRLNRIAGVDAAMYVVAQIIGGCTGISLATIALARLPAHASVNYIATVPGTGGSGLALAAEFGISCALMLVVLTLANHRRLAAFTGVAAGVLVGTYIVFEAPLSGMSMNPARSLGPAVLAGTLDSMWLYVLGPVGGMFTAAAVYQRWSASPVVGCAKLHHPAHVPCIHCASRAAASHAASGAAHVQEVSA